MSVVLLLIVVIITLLFPVLSIPVSIFGLIVEKGWIRKSYGFLLAFSLAVIAFIWIPGNTTDLYRHHTDVITLENGGIESLGSYISKNLEPAHYLLKFFVAQTGKKDLLQFLVVLFGYFEIFWIVCDYANIKKTKRGIFALLLFYAFSGLRFIGFASGLWFYFALINMTLGMYLVYFRKTKYIQWFFFLLAICLHMGVLYILIVALLMYWLRFFKKVSIPRIAMVVFVALSFGTIILLFNNIFDTGSTFGRIINRMYDSYFINGDQYENLHSGWNLFLPLMNAVICFVLGCWASKRDDGERYYSFSVYMAAYIIATIIIAGVFVRFGFLMVMMSLPLIEKFLSSNSDRVSRLSVFIIIMVVGGLRVASSFNQMSGHGLTKQITDNITNSVFVIMDD